MKVRGLHKGVGDMRFRVVVSKIMTILLKKMSGLKLRYFHR